MNRYKTFTYFMIVIEITLFLLCNLWYFNTGGTVSRQYRVEAARVAGELQEKTPEAIDLTQYQTIVSVEEYHPDKLCNEDYLVSEVNGTLYRIAYHAGRDYHILLFVDIAMAFMIAFTIFLLVYIQQRILRPFQSTTQLFLELAKGNLSVPIKEEKGKLFGRFLWGMDMLREKLESNKQKELAFQKEKKTLLLSLSHDIKTPLSAIELYAKALSSGLYESEEKRTAAIEGILHNTGEIKSYVDKIAAASREDFLNLKTDISEFYLSEVMHSIVVYYNDKLTLLHTKFHQDFFEDCLLLGDKDRLIEVLQNAMENAIKYGDGKEIGISFSYEEDCKLIHIKNTGSTLKEEELTNIFDSFYRGSNSLNISGNGLGLYIAKSLMNKMDGNIFAGMKDQDFILTVVVRKA